jgi:hypothetical protein
MSGQSGCVTGDTKACRLLRGDPLPTRTARGNTKNFQWHVRGPRFREYHLLLDERADQIYAATEAIAELVRKVGCTMRGRDAWGLSEDNLQLKCTRYAIGMATRQARAFWKPGLTSGAPDLVLVRNRPRRQHPFGHAAYPTGRGDLKLATPRLS